RSEGDILTRAQAEDVYEEVSEEQYKSIVKGRLQRDDFVVDDGVGGYLDNGMDDFDEPGAYGESDDDDNSKIKKKKAKPKPVKKAPKAAKAAPPPPTANAYRPVKPDEKDFMASLLAGMDAAPSGSSRSRKRKSSPEPVDFGSLRRRRDDFPSSDPFSDGLGDDPVIMSPAKRVKTTNGGGRSAASSAFPSDKSSSPAVGALDLNDEDDDFVFTDDDLMAIDTAADAALGVKREEQDVKMPDVQPKPKAVKKEEPPSWLNVHASLAVADPDTMNVALGSASGAGQLTDIDALQEDGSFWFYWLDYFEKDGVHLIGKCMDKKTKAWISCCVSVKGIERNLYVLKRDKKAHGNDEDDEEDEDDVVSDADVRSDFNEIRKAANISSWRGKWVTRKYAFGEKDVPTGEQRWYKVIYGFDCTPDVATENIARVFGTNTTAFELLAKKRKIMGPCWLKVDECTKPDGPISWCKFEVVVNDPKMVNPFSDSDAKAPRDMPPLNIMSLSLRTIVNHQDNQRELVCASARVWTDMRIDDERQPNEIPCEVHTFVRPLEQGKWPPKFQETAKNNKTKITACDNEFALLSRMLVLLQGKDPDVIVGHDFVGVSLDVLLHRLRTNKSKLWSRIGRFRIPTWPHIGKQGSNLKFLPGRLVCDLASDGAKSMISSTTWSMSEMCATHLKLEREDIDPNDTGAYFDHTVSSPTHLLHFVRHCEMDAHYQMAIAAKVQILPLTKQLTNLAGNSWNKTLNGGRAERNEYILLHEFHRLKYICPDKTYGKKSVVAAKAEAEEGDQAAATTGKGKRDKFKGGLVLQPKRGLWDKFILVMDFNSLYPSIIQEYNIDFTTVDIAEFAESDELPEAPPSETPQGVLPRLIATLVQRRQQVKKLMKEPGLADAKRKQYDIRQQALKLTANSMYGCLGFEYSRFYARPLAALTTHMGRQTLSRTRELAEGMSLDVVYGDTDSVFLNSGKLTLKEAKQVANEFKKVVNEQYKLLEIDLDGVFQRLLLLQKKKYAALKVEGVDDKMFTTKEVKGLDMKRREYCALSKDVSNYVLDQILSGEATEVVVEKIHEYLTSLGNDVRAGKLATEKFIIHKRLGKRPEDYPDAKSQPHVQVALRLQKEGNARIGDVIPYIFCAKENATQAERAFHPDELRRSEKADEKDKLKIDFEFYLSNQILPPIERLCDPIEGTDRARLAECLGLDAKKYQTYASGEQEERPFGTLESQVPDKERFKQCEPFRVKCRSCKKIFAFGSLGEAASAHAVITPGGCVCPECKTQLQIPSVQTQLEVQIRDHIARYYQMWMVCQDSTCGHRTRMMGVYGKRCLRPTCAGSVVMEYSDLALYTQLLYYRSLFDGDKAVNKAKGAKQEELRALVALNHTMLQALQASVDRFLDMNGRHWVDMGELFSFMKLS
ncbi:hypothetical protein EXIGLDRAFT_615021, partial [Exidia glandulosa HHB12029]